jgi:N-acetylmuramoyl-L-alanine amidase
MRKVIAVFTALAILTITSLSAVNWYKQNNIGAPPYGEPEENAPQDVLSWISNWKRPDIPAKVALQVGHYNSKDLPDELENIRGNTGASGGGFDEWEVNLVIAQETAKKLRRKSIDVEILPATIPPGYWADIFIAIHADGSTDLNKRGYKAATPWRDFTNDAEKFVDILENSYQQLTGWEKDPNITRNMRGYYAFSWWRYDHSIHPMTTAVILETGFLTNHADRALLINNPEIPAQAINDAVLTYLEEENLLP